ncbi:hypothetical protein FKP32DRAFT_1594726 [Trametes sanguinea]|nr:hypothetical protein FKP32DRAFT_1594726 [Trametes sanguinea]
MSASVTSPSAQFGPDDSKDASSHTQSRSTANRWPGREARVVTRRGGASTGRGVAGWPRAATVCTRPPPAVLLLHRPSAHTLRGLDLLCPRPTHALSVDIGSP